VKKEYKKSLGEKTEIKNFQIALYLMALENVVGLRPAGAELVALKSRGTRHGIGRGEIIEKAGLADALGKGWNLVDEVVFRDFMDRAREKMTKLVLRIRSGEIVTAPDDPANCGPGDCDAADICRYDRWLGGKKAEE
jgi:hypothetical protein